MRKVGISQVRKITAAAEMYFDGSTQEVIAQRLGRKLAEDKGVDIKTYSIIYQLIDDVTLALEGMLTPEKVEKYIRV